ncbi:thioredoxin family protein [Oceanithermus sp.]|uniref:thioredoxin family protein n=1 Tax=Oceanithermus sp. TaxID=2268145 RepID=UPI0025811E46|nr:thioredoxin family protein [Oceanithermus sp.]
MAVMESQMVPLGSPAPGFDLPDVVSGRNVSLHDFTGRPLLVVFMSNHCPYARHIERKLAEVANAYAGRGVATVWISSNDVENYPADAPEKLAEQARRVGARFPYLYDASQEVAKAYKAVCTPDLFLYDAEHKLFYRGRFDATRPEKGTPGGEDLIRALDALLAGQDPPEPQHPSMGCNIKWKPGNEPDYFS